MTYLFEKVMAVQCKCIRANLQSCTQQCLCCRRAGAQLCPQCQHRLPRAQHPSLPRARPQLGTSPCGLHPRGGSGDTGLSCSSSHHSSSEVAQKPCTGLLCCLGGPWPIGRKAWPHTAPLPASSLLFPALCRPQRNRNNNDTF